MLAYAFRTLHEDGYKNLSTEEFENPADLCAAILITGVKLQIKRGLLNEYIADTDMISSIRGKIEIAESIKTQSMIRSQMVCTYDEFSIDCKPNQIIKATIMLLIKSDIPLARKKELRKLTVYLDKVSDIDVKTINWNMVYNRNNRTYRLLISICQLVVKGLLQSQSNGVVKMMDFIDEQHMSHLYERFILEYFKKHFPVIKTNSPKIKWALDNDEDLLLPSMQSDIMLTYNDKTLIIDAKYYSHTTQTYHNVRSLHSANLYQIFTYVKNESAHKTNVSGMLLYAQTDTDEPLNQEYSMSGNKIYVKTINLNCNFNIIKDQLNEIAELFMRG